MAMGYVVVSVVTGEPLDTFDMQDQADGYVDAINRTAGESLARAVPVARNPRWSPRTSPEKVLDAIGRAQRPSRLPAQVSG